MLNTRRRTRRLVPLTVAGAMALTAAVAPVASAAEGDTVTIDVYGINDFHGRIEAGSGIGGAAVMAGAIAQLRAANPNSVFVSAGDNVGASTFTSFIQQDNPTLAALNTMGLEVSALGNHEFDKGRTDVDGHLTDPAAGGAEFPYLAANLIDKATGQPAYDPYWITDVSGIRVAFVGAVTEALPELVSPAGISTLEVTAVVPSVNAVADELSDGDESNGEADVVVALVHEGPDTPAIEDSTDDSVFGQIVAGLDGDVDAIFSGHTHQAFAHQIPVAGWPDGLTRPVVQSGSYGANLDHVQFVVDATTKQVVANGSGLLPLAGAYPADSAVQAIVDQAVADAAGPGSVSLGTITADLRRGQKVDGSEDRGAESTLGNFVADVQLWAGQQTGAQIAFMNPGGLRTDLVYATSGDPVADPDGNVTYREAANVQPFANTLVALNLTGAQVRQVLEEQWQPAGASRPFLKLGVAGMTYTYDPTAAAGSRITGAWVGGVALNPTATYRVIANSFLAAGGDNFATLAQGSNVADTGQVDLQAFVAYMAEVGTVSPDLHQRAIGVHVNDVPAAGYLPGDTVSVALSSLLMSKADGQGDTVTLAINGTEVASGTIDPTRVDTTDEVGRAELSFALPSGLAAGSVPVTVTVPSTGSTTTFAIPVATPPPPPPPACTVAYTAVTFGRTFIGVVTVTNGPKAAPRWNLKWDWSNGERAQYGVAAHVQQVKNHVTVTGVRWNRNLPANGTTTFGVVGYAKKGLVAPATFTLSGKTCVVLTPSSGR